MILQTLDAKVDTALQRAGVHGGCSLIVAFSGGPDSTALLAALQRLSVRWNLELYAAYFDHGIQPEGDRESERHLVRHIRDLLGVRCIEGGAPPGDLQHRARAGGLSLESVAREARYGFLRDTREALGADYVATGHTLSDQIETLVMRFFQGSGPHGLRGVPRRRGAVVRPLRDCTREEVLAYLGERGLPFHLDPSNTGSPYLRNRIRRDLMPLVREIFPGSQRSLQRLASKMKEVSSLLEKLSANVVWEPRGATGVATDYRSWRSLPRALRRESLLAAADRVLRELGAREAARVPERFLSTVLAGLSPGGARTGAGLRVFHAGKKLCVDREAVVRPAEKGYLIVVGKPRNCVIETPALRVFIRVRDRCEVPSGDQTVDQSLAQDAILVRISAIRHPLTIRSRRKGDRIATAGGSRSLKKLYGEWGVPEHCRLSLPVVADREGVLAVAGRTEGFPDVAARREGQDAEIAEIRIVKRS